MIKDKNQSWPSFLIEMAVLICVVLFIRFYVFQFFRVSGPSMCPTLNMVGEECLAGNGEFIFVNEGLYNFIRSPKRGEVIIFRPPNKNKYYVKRIMGVPGDKIEIRNGKVLLTNEELGKISEIVDEPYLSDRNRGRTYANGKNDFTVPAEHLLVFGDNRDQSLDSRQCFSSGGCSGNNTPFVPYENVIGKASFVIWPIWKFRILENGLQYLEEPPAETTTNE